MRLDRIAGTFFWIVITSAAAIGQQGSDTNGQPSETTTRTVTVRTYPDGGQTAWRREQTRRNAGSRETVVDTEETSGVDGRSEIIAETIRTGPGAAQFRRDVFAYDGPQRQRRLLETTQSEQHTLADASTRTIENTWVPDVNGHLDLASRWIEERRSKISQTDETLLLPGVNAPLQKGERTVQTERQINAVTFRHDSTRMFPDINGGWQPVERRIGEIRRLGPSESLEEETIRRQDVNGTLAASERSVTRRSEANGREQVVIETYSRHAGGSARLDSSLDLSQRVRISTTSTADGGRKTVEEVEARSPVAPGDPMRVVQRTVATVRAIGPGQWVTERQVFELDVNNRLVPIMTETEEAVR